MPIFNRTIGIDYSGAETPTASLKGLRVYMANDDRLPVEVPPPSSPRKYWTRKGVAEWLVERLAEDVATLIGIDHGFSFPLRYFEAHRLLPDWSRFLDDFQRHWPTDEDHTYVEFVRDGSGCDVAELPYTHALARVLVRALDANEPVIRFDDDDDELVITDSMKHEMRVVLDALDALGL